MWLFAIARVRFAAFRGKVPLPWVTIGVLAIVLAVTMTLFMASLAGIPPLAGWFAKFVMFRSIIDAGTGWGVALAAGTGEVFSYVVHHPPPVPGKKLPMVVALPETQAVARPARSTAGITATGHLILP